MTVAGILVGFAAAPADGMPGHASAPKSPTALRLLLAAALLTIEPGNLLAHDAFALRMLAAGDASRAEWFGALRTPSGRSCCDLGDCQQAQAAWRGDTQGWWVLVNGLWRPVPADKVLSTPRSIDGAAYVCASASTGVEGAQPGPVTTMLAPIYCFVPPDAGF